MSEDICVYLKSSFLISVHHIIAHKLGHFNRVMNGGSLFN